MRVAVGVRRIYGPAPEDGSRRIRDVHGDEPTVPVREEGQSAIRGRLCAVTVDRIRVATQAGRRGPTKVMNDAPVGHLHWRGGVGDVDEPEVAAPDPLASPARRIRFGVFTGRH